MHKHLGGETYGQYQLNENFTTVTLGVYTDNFVDQGKNVAIIRDQSQGELRCSFSKLVIESLEMAPGSRFTVNSTECNTLPSEMGSFNLVLGKFCYGI